MSLPTHSPKIVIIGAGSLFFGRKLIWAVNHLQGLTNAHLALVDTDPEHLAKMQRLAELACGSAASSVKVTASTNFRDELPGADFVILSFSHRNAHYRGIDCAISERYGIRMCSGDTIGPGGVFRALRELPKVMEIADAVAEVCPTAWLINYINPSTVIGMALQRHAKTRNFALCDSLHLPYLHYDYMRAIGLDRADEPEFTMKIAGVNHFTWLLESTFRGENVLPRIHEAIRQFGEKEPAQAPAKGLYNRRIAAMLADVFGALPVCTAHTKEYVPYFQGYGPLADVEAVPPLSIFEHEDREKATREMWDEVAAYGSGQRPISEFHEKGSSDHATDVIQAIWNDSGRHLFVNVPNRGTVPNLPDDAVLELECVVGRAGPKPVPVGPMPLGLRALQMQILDTHELTVEAFLRKDRGLLLRALAVDPIVNSLAAAEAVLRDLYKAEEDVLEPWIAPSSKPAACSAGSAQAVLDTVHQGQTAIA